MSENKLIIFDLDGVLIESKDAHHEALNKALKKYGYTPISDEDRPNFEALPTREKLKKLSYVAVADHQKLRDMKAQYFEEDFIDYVVEDVDLWARIWQLKNKGFKIAVASNAIRTTVYAILGNLGIMNLVDLVVSNEDVKNPKPHPEMYWKCMSELNVLPLKTLIFEDSPVGIEGAQKSGADVAIVYGPVELIQYLDEYLAQIEHDRRVDSNIKEPVLPIKPKRNIVIPMAGAGSRFRSAGFDLPKPLIDVAGKPMIEWVLDNLKDVEGQRIFIVQDADDEKYDLTNKLLDMVPDCIVLSVDGLTKGAVMSVLEAQDLIDNDIPLLIVNSDQYIKDGILWDYALSQFDSVDGGIITFPVYDGDPRWSYVQCNYTSSFAGRIEEVAEKKAISNMATTGIYSFTQGSEFVRLAQKMIDKNITHNNEFYIAPVFNQGIEEGKHYIPYAIEAKRFNGLGDPVSVVNYLNKVIKEKEENVD